MLPPNVSKEASNKVCGNTVRGHVDRSLDLCRGALANGGHEFFIRRSWIPPINIALRLVMVQYRPLLDSVLASTAPYYSRHALPKCPVPAWVSRPLQLELKVPPHTSQLELASFTISRDMILSRVN